MRRLIAWFKGAVIFEEIIIDRNLSNQAIDVLRNIKGKDVVISFK